MSTPIWTCGRTRALRLWVYNTFLRRINNAVFLLRYRRLFPGRRPPKAAPVTMADIEWALAEARDA